MNAFEWLRAYLLARVPLDIAAEVAGLPLSSARAERLRLQLKGEFGGEEQAAAAVAAIGDKGVQAWGQLLLLRSRLESTKGTIGADALELVPEGTLAHLVAREELARHNVRQQRGWARTAQGWDGAGGAFGSLGVALALQGGK